jgi:hypothetical protein
MRIKRLGKPLVWTAFQAIVVLCLMQTASLAGTSSYSVIVDADYEVNEIYFELDGASKTIWVNQGGTVGHVQYLCICVDADGDEIRECYFVESYTLDPSQPYYYSDSGCFFSDDQGNPPPSPPQPGFNEEWCRPIPHGDCY